MAEAQSNLTPLEFLLARVAEDEAAAHSASQLINDAGFIPTFTPARLLAECAAKRRIIDANLWIGDDDKRWDYMSDNEAGVQYQWQEALRALAAAYRDHPDFQQEWLG